ncbi:MAG: histone H1 [Idiomarina sp.]|nr:histone H1 [Idiomarina sp.]
MYQTLLATQTDFDKFRAGNKSAGTRLRKSMQDIKTMAQEVRVTVQNEKNAVVA